MTKTIASGAMRVNISVRVGRFRGAKGMAHLGLIMDNEHERILAKSRRTVKRAAMYSRGVMRRGMRRGRSKKVKVDVRATNKSGKYITKRSSKTVRTRSQPGKPPNYHAKGKGFGLKWIWAQKIGGNPYIWEIGPEFRRTKGSRRVSFQIDKMQESGGRGTVQMPADPNPATMSTNDFFNSPLKKPEMRWVHANYPKRPYTSPALRPTLAKFKSLFGKSFG